MLNDRPIDSTSMTDVYTDLGGLQSIKTTGHKDQRKALQEISVQFESMMMSMMLKSMRQANNVFSEGNPLIGKEEKFYRDMFDQQLSTSLGKSGSIGIAEAMFRQLEKTLPPEPVNAVARNTANNEKSLPASEQKPVAERINALIASVREYQQIPDNMQDVETMLAEFPLTEDVEKFSEIDLWLTPSPAKTVEFFDPESMQKPSQAELSNPADKAGLQFDGSPERFVQQLYHYAEKAAEAIGVNPQVLLAQAALETGWGQKLIQKQDGESSFNLFNIKAGKKWQGDYVTVPTLEYRDGIAVKEQAAFRSYSNPQDSFADYVELINQNPRYKRAMQHAENPARYVRELERAGYATDPQYAEKIIQIMNSDSMKKTLGMLSTDIDMSGRG
jgi:flagellar protein FlgJ